MNRRNALTVAARTIAGTVATIAAVDAPSAARARESKKEEVPNAGADADIKGMFVPITLAGPDTVMSGDELALTIELDPDDPLVNASATYVYTAYVGGSSIALFSPTAVEFSAGSDPLTTLTTVVQVASNAAPTTFFVKAYKDGDAAHYKQSESIQLFAPDLSLD